MTSGTLQHPGGFAMKKSAGGTPSQKSPIAKKLTVSANADAWQKARPHLDKVLADPAEMIDAMLSRADEILAAVLRADVNPHSPSEDRVEVEKAMDLHEIAEAI